MVVLVAALFSGITPRLSLHVQMGNPSHLAASWRNIDRREMFELTNTCMVANVTSDNLLSYQPGTPFSMHIMTALVKLRSTLRVLVLNAVQPKEG